MTEPRTPAPWRLPLAVVLAAVGVVFARLAWRAEDMIALTWAGAAVLVWVAAAVPAGALRWQPRQLSAARSLVPAIVLGVGLGVLLTLGGWLLSVVGMQSAVAFVLAPADRVPWGWALFAVLALALGEELALRQGVFALAPRPARILGTMALSVIAWLVIANEVAALGAVVVGLATARQRYVTGALVAPVVTHMLAAGLVFVALPPLVA